MKQGNQELVGVLRMTLSAINAKEKEKRYALSVQKPEAKEEDLIQESALADSEMIDVIISEIKKRKDAIVLYEKGSRQDLVQRERYEISMLQPYLPKQLSGEELQALIQESIARLGAKEIKDMGRVMADLSPKIKGRADNSEVSNIIKGILSK
jgi:uncharacterized protein YqeY